MVSIWIFSPWIISIWNSSPMGDNPSRKIPCTPLNLLYILDHLTCKGYLFFFNCFLSIQRSTIPKFVLSLVQYYLYYPWCSTIHTIPGAVLFILSLVQYYSYYPWCSTIRTIPGAVLFVLSLVQYYSYYPWCSTIHTIPGAVLF